jgi:4-azaleucine resistance transporter AzlC
MKKQTLRTAFLATIPVMAGYLVLGTAFGILTADKGLSLIWPLAMSLFIYAGSMQFVAINLLTGGASLVSAALMTLMVNARHLFYGVTMLDKYKKAGKEKPYLIFSLTDETFALVCNGAPKDVSPRLYYFFVSLLNQCYWVIGSVLGSLLGSAMTFDTSGIDFAMTALFVVIFTEQILTAKSLIPPITGVVCSVCCLLLFKSERFLIPSMLCITAVLLLCGAKEPKKKEESL